jgi:hypothetical protein
MLPFVRDGDIAVIRAAETGEIEVGDVVFYDAAPERQVLHRVVRRQGGALVARGDALLDGEAVDPARLLGRLVVLERAGRARRLDTRGARLRGRAIVTIAPLVARVLPAARAARRAWYGQRG